jgi:predicted nucleic acid-binding protein
VSGVFLDSNVILYLLSADAVKADTAETLLTHQPTISVQVLNEVTSVCQRKLKLDWPQTLDLLNAIKANCKIVDLTLDTHAKALEVAQQHQLSFYDALIVAAAIFSGANTLMSEDMHHGAIIQGIRVHNPFTHPNPLSK